MKKNIVFLTAITVLVLAASAVFADEIYYVQSMKARIMSEPSFKSNLIAEVPRGFKIISGEKAGSWIKVIYGGKQGYIALLLVSNHPPLDKMRLIKADEGQINRSVRRRASTYTSAAAARGLTGEDRKRVSTEEEVDYKAVERMETLTFSNEELTRFEEGDKR